MSDITKQGYTTEDPSASAWGLEFEREAEKLLKFERSDSLTTLSGLALSSYSHGAHGQFSDGSRKYAIQLWQMGRRVKLFGVASALWHDELQHMTPNHQRAYSSAAWGGFKTLMLLSLFHVLDPIAIQPALPYPSNDPSADNSEYTISSSFCRLWSILSGILSTYRDGSSLGATLAFAYTSFGKLLALASDLPVEMTRREHSPLTVIFFHIVYHTAILETFRPFVHDGSTQRAKQRFDSTATPQAIFSASVQQLKSLVVDCRSQHKSADTTTFWAGIGLLQVANAALKDLTRPDWRYYLLICIRGYQALYPAFAVCKGIVQGLLAMAVELGAITVVEVRLIMGEFLKGGNFHSAITHAKGSFVVDFDLAVQNRQEAAIGKWVNRFQEIQTFSEFTEGVL